MKRLIYPLIFFILFMGEDLVFAQATVEGKLILPEPAPGREYGVLVDQDFNGDNGFVKYCLGICGSDTAVSYTISDVPAGTYYIYAVVRIVSYSGNPPEVGDYMGIYGGTIDEYPSEPNAVVPASGTVTFDIIMSKWTWEEMFGSHIISQNFDGASSVFAADIDSDGDMDVLGSARDANEIAWWENDGSQGFLKRTIDNQFEDAKCVHAADLDNDADMDVVAVANFGHEIAWWENDGSQNFNKHKLAEWLYASSVYTIDLDDDDDMDIIGASWGTNEIAWWENNGSQTFTKHFVDSCFGGACDVYATDIDGDDDVDVVGAGNVVDEIAWWENNGSENFTKHVVEENFNFAFSVYAIDMENDGDVDIIGAARYGDEISWWENDGASNFTKHLVDDQIGWPNCVSAADIDQDGDMDILGVAYWDDIIGWYENLGENNFKRRILAGNLLGASAVHAADIDGDEDLDVIGAAEDGDIILWWENTLNGVAVHNTGSSNLPEKFALNQNYPNPFNLSTKIRFNVPMVSHITIKIYDILGREVKKLVDSKYQPGSHSVIWDGKDDEGNRITSGIFFMRMQVDDFIAVKKLISLK